MTIYDKLLTLFCILLILLLSFVLWSNAYPIASMNMGSIFGQWSEYRKTTKNMRVYYQLNSHLGEFNSVLVQKNELCKVYSYQYRYMDIKLPDETYYFNKVLCKNGIKGYVHTYSDYYFQ